MVIRGEFKNKSNFIDLRMYKKNLGQKLNFQTNRMLYRRDSLESNSTLSRQVTAQLSLLSYEYSPSVLSLIEV